MSRISDLVKIARECNVKWAITENSSEAEKLRAELMRGGLSKNEYLELRRRVADFFESDASESDKKMVRGYTEILAIKCLAIEAGLMD